MIYRMIALLRGWSEARDAEDDSLVVFSNRLAIHYTGSDAWKRAALHR